MPNPWLRPPSSQSSHGPTCTLDVPEVSSEQRTHPVCSRVLTLRNILTTLFFFFMSLLFASVTAYLVPAWNKSSEKLAEDTFAVVQNNIKDRVLAFLEPVKLQNVILEQGFYSGALDQNAALDQPHAVRNLMYNLISNMNDTSTKWGRQSDGAAIGVVRRGRLLSWHIVDTTNQTSLRREKYLVDDKGALTKVLGYDSFDIRSLKWWREAKVLQMYHSWSTIFFSNLQPDPKLAATLAHFDANGDPSYMISTDKSLDRVNGFLDDLRKAFTPQGVIWLMQPTDFLLVGSSVGDSINDNGLQISATRSVSAIIQGGAEHLKNVFPEGVMFSDNTVFHDKIKVGSEKYYITASRITDELNLDWLGCTMIPESEVLGDLQTAQRQSFIILAAVLIVALIACWLLLRTVMISIQEISREMVKLSRMEIDLTEDQHKTKALITEIRDMQSAFDNMKHGLSSFQKYVPSTLVRTLMLSGKEASLGLTMSPITTMFMDLEAFTTFSETMASRPDIMTRMMSQYFSAMSEVIVRHRGTVDKFIGDAIMAFWNAPLPVEHHELMACKAALACQSRLKDLHKEWRADDLPILNFRIGINTGPSFVGNIGAPTRMDYTVVGDAVNTASRLEGCNKHFGTRLAVSGNIVEKVEDEVLFRPLGDIILKGKRNTTSVFELVALRSHASTVQTAWCENYVEAFQHYCRGNFARAVEIVDATKETFAELCQGDKPLDMLYERCKKYHATPPPTRWTHEDSLVTLFSKSIGTSVGSELSI